MRKTQAPAPTTAMSIRLNHSTIASLFEFYERKGIDMPTQAGVVRAACEDFVALLIDKDLTRYFTLEEALDRLRHCKGQPGKRHELHAELARQLNVEPLTVHEDKLADDKLDELMKLYSSDPSLKNSTKPESDDT